MKLGGYTDHDIQWLETLSYCKSIRTYLVLRDWVPLSSLMPSSVSPVTLKLIAFTLIGLWSFQFDYRIVVLSYL